MVNSFKDRKQRFKLNPDCRSGWKDVPAEVPWGTKLGPLLFILMIDDVNALDMDLWKYVDHITIAKKAKKKRANKSKVQ